MSAPAKWRAGLAALLLSGCTVGPDFKASSPPAVQTYTEQPVVLAASDGDAASQTFVPGQDVPGEWWKLFGSAPLDALIRQALAANPDLQSAQAAVRVAMENLKAQNGAFYPAVTTGLGATRSKDAQTLSPVLNSNALIYNLYQTQLGVSWNPDLWGENRRQAEVLQAQADGQKYQLQSTYVSLVASLITAAIQEASLRAQIAATGELIQSQAAVLTIEERQHDLGQISGADIAAQQTLLAQSQQLLPALEHQLAQQRNLMTALAGRYAADQVEQTFSLAQFTLPGEIPVSLPSRLVDQRADIRLAEENLHTASALVGVAIANRLPNITLSANLGTIATGAGGIFSAENDFWNMGAGLAAPLFDGGALLHRSRAAEASYAQAQAQYRGTVLAAFQNVANAFAALQADSELAKAAAAAKTAAEKSYAIAEKQVQFGQTGRLELLLTQQALLQNTLADIQARAARLADTAALMQALGGGWEQKPLEAGAENVRGAMP